MVENLEKTFAEPIIKAVQDMAAKSGQQALPDSYVDALRYDAREWDRVSNQEFIGSSDLTYLADVTSNLGQAVKNLERVDLKGNESVGSALQSFNASTQRYLDIIDKIPEDHQLYTGYKELSKRLEAAQQQTNAILALHFPELANQAQAENMQPGPASLTDNIDAVIAISNNSMASRNEHGEFTELQRLNEAIAKQLSENPPTDAQTIEKINEYAKLAGKQATSIDIFLRGQKVVIDDTPDNSERQNTVDQLNTLKRQFEKTQSLAQNLVESHKDVLAPEKPANAAPAPEKISPVEQTEQPVIDKDQLAAQEIKMQFMGQARIHGLNAADAEALFNKLGQEDAPADNAALETMEKFGENIQKTIQSNAQFIASNKDTIAKAEQNPEKNKSFLQHIDQLKTLNGHYEQLKPKVDAYNALHQDKLEAVRNPNQAESSQQNDTSTSGGNEDGQEGSKGRGDRDLSQNEETKPEVALAKQHAEQMEQAKQLVIQAAKSKGLNQDEALDLAQKEATGLLSQPNAAYAAQNVAAQAMGDKNIALAQHHTEEHFARLAKATGLKAPEGMSLGALSEAVMAAKNTSLGSGIVSHSHIADFSNGLSGAPSLAPKSNDLPSMRQGTPSFS